MCRLPMAWTQRATASMVDTSPRSTWETRLLATTILTMPSRTARHLGKSVTVPLPPTKAAEEDRPRILELDLFCEFCAHPRVRIAERFSRRASATLDRVE